MKMASCRSSAGTTVPSAFSYRHVQGILAEPPSWCVLGTQVNVTGGRSGAEQDGPDGLAAAGNRAPAPDVAQMVHHLQPAAGLLALLRGPQDRGAVGWVEHRTHDLAGSAQQAQADRLARARGPGGVRDGVGDELADDHLGVIRERHQAPLLQGVPGEAPGGDGGGIPPVGRHPDHSGASRRALQPRRQVEGPTQGRVDLGTYRQTYLAQAHRDPAKRRAPIPADRRKCHPAREYALNARPNARSFWTWCKCSRTCGRMICACYTIIVSFMPGLG